MSDIQWSKYIQPPEFMEATRQSFLHRDFAPIVADYCGIKPNMHVLEVGCGTGAFSRYLAEAVQNVSFIGVDIDQDFIAYAKNKKYSLPNMMKYTVGNAEELPFEDNTFDAVFSHTFLTCINEPKRVMTEMIRVLKKNGIVSSITAMSYINQTWHTGYYPVECTWYKRYCELYGEMYNAYEHIFPSLKISNGIPASETPRFFRDFGLKDIKLLPLSRAFSLSNSALSKTEKITYIENKYTGEYKKATNFMSLEKSKELIAEEIYSEYLQLLCKWRNFWLENTEDDTIWDWFGSSSLLISGRKE